MARADARCLGAGKFESSRRKAKEEAGPRCGLEASGRRDVLKAFGLGFVSLFLPTPTLSAEPSGDRETNSPFMIRDGAASTGWIDFEMPESRYIVLNAMLNREPAEVLLDSGVGSMVLDLSLATKLGLKPQHAAAAVGITELAAGTTMEGLTVSIGDMVLTPPKTMAFDLSPFDVATSRPIRALLGSDILAPLLVDIDFENRRIAFRDPKQSAPLNGARQVPLPSSRFGRALSISVEGQTPIEALFDLGSDTPLILSPDYVQAQHVLQGKQTSTSLSIGAGGAEEETIAVVRTMDIGGVSLHDVPVSVPNKWALDVQAVVGFPILSRFRLMTDYGRDRIWMLSSKDAETRDFQKDRLGMAATPATDCLRVVHVSLGSPAALAGLKPGDEIVAVNDQRVDAKYFKDRPRQGMKPAGTLLQLRLRSGSNLTITLADYY